MLCFSYFVVVRLLFYRVVFNVFLSFFIFLCRYSPLFAATRRSSPFIAVHRRSLLLIAALCPLRRLLPLFAVHCCSSPFVALLDSAWGIRNFAFGISPMGAKTEPHNAVKVRKYIKNFYVNNDIHEEKWVFLLKKMNIYDRSRNNVFLKSCESADMKTF